MTAQSAFAFGYEIGSRYGEQSARETLDRFPAMTGSEVDAFGQGSIDGEAGDTFRLYPVTLANVA